MVLMPECTELYDLFYDLGRRINFFDKKIDTVFQQSEACQLITKVKGIGPKTATSVVAAIDKETEFKNGLHFSAWLGLVPRQHSSSYRQVLMNMTKKGDNHLQTLFIHRARVVVRVAANNNEGYLNQWVNQLKERRGFNKTTVAVPIKMPELFGQFFTMKQSTDRQCNSIPLKVATY